MAVVAGSAGGSTRRRRDRARAADRARGGSAAGVFTVCCVGAALWVRRLLPLDQGLSVFQLVLGSVVAVLVGILVASRLDLTAPVNELSRRLRLERAVHRRLRAAGLTVLNDRTVDGGATISHLVLRPGAVLVLVDAATARWAPWRPSVARDAGTAPVWQAWVDASAGALALTRELRAACPEEPLPQVSAAVVADVTDLPRWGRRLPVHTVGELPGALAGPAAPAEGWDVARLAATIGALALPAR